MNIFRTKPSNKETSLEQITNIILPISGDIYYLNALKNDSEYIQNNKLNIKGKIDFAEQTVYKYGLFLLAFESARITSDYILSACHLLK